MNPLVDLLISRGLLLDFAGMLGLSLLALTAVKISRCHGSWATTLLVIGSLSLLLSRAYYIVAPHLITNELLYHAGPLGITLLDGLPPLLLTTGLAGVTWGLWGHHRWLQSQNR